MLQRKEILIGVVIVGVLLLGLAMMMKKEHFKSYMRLPIDTTNFHPMRDERSVRTVDR